MSMADEPQDEGGDDDKGRQLRIKLPLSYHLKLHKLKLLTGKNMADAIQEALDTYFQTVFAPDSAEPLPTLGSQKDAAARRP